LFRQISIEPADSPKPTGCKHDRKYHSSPDRLFPAHRRPRRIKIQWQAVFCPARTAACRTLMYLTEFDIYFEDLRSMFLNLFWTTKLQAGQSGHGTDTPREQWMNSAGERDVGGNPR
jgi:hypothetical protein